MSRPPTKAQETVLAAVRLQEEAEEVAKQPAPTPHDLHGGLDPYDVDERHDDGGDPWELAQEVKRTW